MITHLLLRWRILSDFSSRAFKTHGLLLWRNIDKQTKPKKKKQLFTIHYTILYTDLQLQNLSVWKWPKCPRTLTHISMLDCYETHPGMFDSFQYVLILNVSWLAPFEENWVHFMLFHSQVVKECMWDKLKEVCLYLHLQGLLILCKPLPNIGPYVQKRKAFDCLVWFNFFLIMSKLRLLYSSKSIYLFRLIVKKASALFWHYVGVLLSLPLRSKFLTKAALKAQSARRLPWTR